MTNADSDSMRMSAAGECHSVRTMGISVNHCQFYADAINGHEQLHYLLVGLRSCCPDSCTI